MDIRVTTFNSVGEMQQVRHILNGGPAEFTGNLLIVESPSAWPLELVVLGVPIGGRLEITAVEDE